MPLGHERVLILGASRGLGAELVKVISERQRPCVGFSRKLASLEKLNLQYAEFSYHVADFATVGGQDEVLRWIVEEPFERVFYVAGGGPYGAFEERGWRDHEWSWQVSFLFPARIAHTLLNTHPTRQLIFVGSSIAEGSRHDQGDAFAASYCAAKHALKGLFLSLRSERIRSHGPLTAPESRWDVRLFSPGYMDTDLLPKNAAVRQLGVYNPAQVARELWQWSLTADKGGHKVYPIHPHPEECP